jgi:hypothetical protein
VGDIDTAVVDRLKALDPEWPIREADLFQINQHSRVARSGHPMALTGFSATKYPYIMRLSSLQKSAFCAIEAS